jgi:hypothetical protein
MSAGCTTQVRGCGVFATYDRQVSQRRNFKMHGANFSLTVPAKILTAETHNLGLGDSRDVPNHVS